MLTYTNESKVVISAKSSAINHNSHTHKTLQTKGKLVENITLT